MRPRAAFAAAALLLLGASHARAAEPDAATTLTAVQLADEAGDLFQAGKFAEALDRYQRADALVKRHTIGVRIARCLAHLGRLTEAAARYDAVVRMDLPSDLSPDKLAKQKEAQAQAESERDALVPRIPHVVVQLTGPPDTAVTIDGQPVPAALLGVKRAIDPGPHHIEARVGEVSASRDVVLEEGEVLPVPIELHPPPPPVVPPPPIVPPPPLVPHREEPPPVPHDVPDAGKGRRTAGYALLGVGGAGILLGLATGGVAFARNRSLHDPGKCGSDLDQCPPSTQGDVNTYNTLRNVSTGGFVAGGVVAATGAVLVLTALPPSPGKAASFFVGPTGFGLKGAF